MEVTTFHSNGNFESAKSAQGRGRAIAAFHVAQNAEGLTDAEMRRDVLVFLMGPVTVSDWLHDRQWLKLSRKVNGIELLSLTDEGQQACHDSLAGAGDVPTQQQIVDEWVAGMRNGSSVCKRARQFDSI